MIECNLKCFIQLLTVGAILSGLPCSYVAQLYTWRAIFVIMEILAAAATVLMIVFRTITPVIENKTKTR